MIGPGFQSFVAWRYLMARPMRLSKPIMALILGCLVTSAAGLGIGFGLRWWFDHHNDANAFNKFMASMSPLHAYDRLGMFVAIGVGAVLLGVGAALAIPRGEWRRAIGWALILGGVLTIVFGVVSPQLVAKRTFVEWSVWWGAVALAPLALLIPLLIFRVLFTFFTTVSMAGVFVGAMALVVVLSVMSGFESDLQDKILGSNAHIRVTREEGMMSDWPEVMARIKKVPGVVAVTPYATSEVVLSANSNYASVIIKGIDPATVGEVTELVDDLDDPDAMKRLYPLAEDPLDQTVDVDDPPDGGVPAGPDASDPAPDDMSGGADPMDLSGEGDVDADGGAASDDEAPDDFGGGEADPIDLSGDEDEDEDNDEAADVRRGSFGGDATLLAGADDEDDDDAPRAGVLDPAPSDFEGPGDEDDPPADLSGDTGRVTVDSLTKPDLSGLPSTDGGRLALLDGVLVGKELYKQLHLFVGEEVRLVSPLADPANPDATGTPIPFHRDYRIAGVFYTGMYEYDLKFVYVPMESLQAFLQLGDDIDGIEVRIDDPENTGAVSAAIQRELGPEFAVQDWKELNRNLFSALKLEKIAMFLVLAIIILVASFSIIGNLIMVVVEKGKEIALLKTLGASDTGVMLVFVMQGFFIGLCGTVAGLLEGLAVCWACATFGFPINPDVYYIDQLPIHIELSSVLAVGAAGLMISAVATLYPALIAARLRPAIGLRHD